MEQDLNPFQPGADAPPPKLTGLTRTLPTSIALTHPAKTERYDRVMMFHGLSGGGKLYSYVT